MTLASRYRLLLRAYPASYRAERGDEIVGTYLDVAGDRRRPRMSDVTDLLAAGLRERLRARGAAGVTDAVPLAATAALCVAAGLAGVWLFTVEVREIPDTVLLRANGPFQSLGAFVWIAWLVAGVSATVLSGPAARRVVLAALALTVLVAPVAALTPYERPSLLVLVPQVALGLLALGGPARPGPRTRVAVGVVPLVATAPAAFAAVAVADAAPQYGYRATGGTVLATAGAALLGAVLVAALVRTSARDATGWWVLLLLLPPAALLLLQPAIAVAGDVTGLDARTGWPLPATAAVVTLLAVAALPVAVLLRDRWQRG